MPKMRDQDCCSFSSASLSACSFASFSCLSCSAILYLYSLSNSSLSSAVTSLLLIFWYCLYFIQISFLALSPNYSLIGLASKLMMATLLWIPLRWLTLASWFSLKLRYLRVVTSAKSVRSAILFFRAWSRSILGNLLMGFSELMELSARYSSLSDSALCNPFRLVILLPLSSRTSRRGWP